jgi:hypothetical protein
MCNCLEEAKTKILSHLRKDNPEFTIEDSNSDFDNIVYPLDGDNMGRILTHKFEYTYTFTKRDGELSRPKTASININPMYCGFCGKKFTDSK